MRFAIGCQPHSEQPPQYMGPQKLLLPTVGSNLPYLPAISSEYGATQARSHGGLLHTTHLLRPFRRTKSPPVSSLESSPPPAWLARTGLSWNTARCDQKPHGFSAIICSRTAMIDGVVPGHRGGTNGDGGGTEAASDEHESLSCHDAGVFQMPSRLPRAGTGRTRCRMN